MICFRFICLKAPQKHHYLSIPQVTTYCQLGKQHLPNSFSNSSELPSFPRQFRSYFISFLLITNFSYKKSQNHFVRLVLSSPFSIVLSTKSGLNSTKKHQIHLIFRPGTLGDKIFHCVIREHLLEFSIQLSGQCFIMGDNQCGFLQLLDHVGHRKGFA